MIPLLAGTRILELSAVVMGPFAGQILADLGAEVIKVEPIDGDVARASQPQAHDQASGMGALYVNNNRNKRAIAVDLKSARGKEIIDKLIRRSDVLLHNMRPEAADRLGLGFDAVAAINARLIYCSAIGFGQRGRYRGRPAFDDVIQAAAGLAGIAERAGSKFCRAWIFRARRSIDSRICWKIRTCRTWISFTSASAIRRTSNECCRSRWCSAASRPKPMCRRLHWGRTHGPS